MRILLIEDNPGDARLVQEILKEARGNFTIRVAEKLGMGVELLLSQDIDLVLLDLNLPDSSGLATLTELQSRFLHLPIVIMTGLDDEELARQAVRLGAQDYLLKGNVDGELVRRTLIYAFERKQMEADLRKSRDELELRVRERTSELESRNKELRDFAFIASHDLQEPLRKVRTFAGMLVDKCGVSLDEVSRDYLERMVTAMVRMQDLLDSLLAYSRVTTMADPIKETDLGESVKIALSNLEIMIKEKNARVELEDLPTVRGDRVQMIQLFQNLIGNALKFHREGKTPHVKVYARVGDGNGAYQICVEDNGIGFEEKYLDKIFLPFQRLHGRSSDYEGTGMGLAICKKVVERHGGDITARSKLGKGSTFILTLPKEQGGRRGRPESAG